MDLVLLPHEGTASDLRLLPHGGSPPAPGDLTPRTAWVAGTEWRWATDTGSLRAAEGQVTGSGAAYLSRGISGEHWYYTDAHGDERRLSGTDEGPSSQPAGRVAGVGPDGAWWWVDADGRQRRVSGALVRSLGESADADLLSDHTDVALWTDDDFDAVLDVTASDEHETESQLHDALALAESADADLLVSHDDEPIPSSDSFDVTFDAEATDLIATTEGDSFDVTLDVVALDEFPPPELAEVATADLLTSHTDSPMWDSDSFDVTFDVEAEDSMESDFEAPPSMHSHFLATGNDRPQACEAFPSVTLWSTDETLVAGSFLYTNEAGTTPAGDGWYSDGTWGYQVTGGSGQINALQAC